jgi:hypothetical protein
MDKLEIKRALLYNKPSILDSRSGGNQCFDTQAHRSSHLRYFRSPRPILLARIVWLVAKFEDCQHIKKGRAIKVYLSQ